MPTAQTKPPSNGAPPPPSAAQTRSVAKPPPIVTGPGKHRHLILVVNAVEGWGKTSLAAHATKPLVVMAGNETGYETLLDHGRVPDVPRARSNSWDETLALLQAVRGQFGTVALDALGGFERQCHTMVCDRDFKGDWGERGFTAWQRGYDISITEWMHLLSEFEALRDNGSNVLLLSHSRIVPFANPLGPDFNRYCADCHRKTWDATARVADATLFGTFKTVVDTDANQKKGKGIGGSERVLYTERCDAYDAKNRFGMPSRIDMPDDPAQSWSTLRTAIYGDIKNAAH